MDTKPFPTRANIFAIVAILALFALTGVTYLLQKERGHELTRWQNKLDLIADMGTREVGGWLDGQFGELGALADNASVQIYFLQADAHKGDKTPLSENDYLDNLLNYTAERLGFIEPERAAKQNAQVNIKPIARGGIAMVDLEGHVLSSTRGMPPFEPAFVERVKAAPRATPSLLDIAQGADGRVMLGFVLPIYSVQSDHGASTQVGNIVATRVVDERLFSRLRLKAQSEQTLEMILIRAEGQGVRYISPLLANTPPMTQRAETDAGKIASAYALAHPGDFAIRSDYRGKDVLFTSRAITGTPWVLVAKVDKAEAFAASENWQRSILAVAVLAVLVISVTLIAIWRSATARRASDLSNEFKQLAEHADARARLLSLVTENQTDAIYIVDAGMTLWFANQRAADEMNAPADDLRGKTLTQTLGAANAEKLLEPCKAALNGSLMQTSTLNRIEQGTLKNLWVRFIPLESIPIVGADYGTAGVLVVEQDITALVREREKRVQVLNQLVATLVSLIDRRDPHAAQHSSFVARLALATAKEMELDAVLVETVEIAAKLLNIGKMDVPTELLVRSGTLSEQDRKTIRSSLKSSADLLGDIEFEGPVADTLRHAQEFVNGTGPLGLEGEQILISARIVAVANALVGMLSVRAYRDAMSFDAATDQLLKMIDVQFDRKVVFAMLNYLSNHGGREMLSALARLPSEKRPD